MSASAFAAVLPDLNDTAISSFGETVSILLSDNTTLTLSGIFARQRADVEQNVAASTRYTLKVKSADVQGFAIAKQNQVTVSEIVYTIIDIIPDDGGMKTYVMKRYG